MERLDEIRWEDVYKYGDDEFWHINDGSHINDYSPAIRQRIKEGKKEFEEIEAGKREPFRAYTSDPETGKLMRIKNYKKYIQQKNSGVENPELELELEDFSWIS